MKNVRDAEFSRKRAGMRDQNPPLPDPLLVINDDPLVVLACDLELARALSKA